MTFSQDYSLYLPNLANKSTGYRSGSGLFC